MQPIPVNIQELAIYDPIAAYGIVLNIPRVPIVMNVPAVFSSFAIPQVPVVGALDTVIATRTWIDKIDYSLQQPNVFSGNVFKSLYDAMLKAQPGVSIRMQVNSGPRYVSSTTFVPLENFANLFASQWPAGWPLFKQQSIAVDFQLTASPPAVDPNGPPYIVTLTIAGWQFLDQSIDNLSAQKAGECLRKMGFWVPDVACLREMNAPGCGQ